MSKEVSIKVEKYATFSLDEAGDKLVIKSTKENLDNMLELFKTDSVEVFTEHICSIVSADYREDVDQARKNRAAVDKMVDLAPRDSIEVSLCVQMLILHQQFVYMTRVSNNIDVNSGESVLAARTHAMRLSREYLNHVDTLRKYRTGGVQTIKHIHVNEGGQAVVELCE